MLSRKIFVCRSQMQYNVNQINNTTLFCPIMQTELRRSQPRRPNLTYDVMLYSLILVATPSYL